MSATPDETRPGPARAGAAIRRVWRSISWYVKEVVGENDYEHYLAHLRKHHREGTPVSRREFERAKMDRMSANPKARCC